MKTASGLFTIAIVAMTALSIVLASASAPQDTSYRAPRTAEGKPDLKGIWRAMGTAHWDIEGHEARHGPLPQMGALGATREW